MGPEEKEIEMSMQSRGGSLNGKVALVTGAASGIGRATARAFAREGASVVVVDVDEASNRETERQVADAGARALAIRCDVTNADDVEAALQRTVEVFGRLDLAFNNAGVEPRTLVPTAETDVAEWDRILGVDLRGVFLSMKYEIPLMLAGGGGAIVNASSGAGVIGIENNAAYAAAKHGVIGLTRSAALEYAARSVRINAICPGYIDTPMIERFAGTSAEARAAVIAQEPIGRMGTVEEIAATVTWMCSDAAGFMIGHALVVDGGQTII